MPTPKQQRRRALELLEASIDGCTEAIMLAYGFKTKPSGRPGQRWARDGEHRAMITGGIESKSPACGLPRLAGGRSRSFDGPDAQDRPLRTEFYSKKNLGMAQPCV
jgi:hypothetical protein